VQAILSDIHANIEALEAVLADIEKHSVWRVICLGDVIGYGPNPKECIDLAKKFNVTILGNHEEALLVQLQQAIFNVKARDSIDWTRAQLDMSTNGRGENASRWDFLGSLKESYQTDDMLFVHGTPTDPIGDYLYPRDIQRPDKLRPMFEVIGHICFVGHTHVPGIWMQDMVYLTVQEVNSHYWFTRKKTIVNVGSVGQPRDGDNRACYVLLHDGHIEFRKVPYPVEKTVSKIRKVGDLDPFLAERLLQGR